MAYTKYIVGSYEKVYNGQIVGVRLFDMTNHTIHDMYSISWVQHLRNFSMWVCSTWNKKPWCPVTAFNPDASYDVQSALTGFYEFTFWNGQRKLIRTVQGVFHCPSPSLNRSVKKVLHVSICGHDVTDFVNRYVCSLTKENEISANDLFELAILDHMLPPHYKDDERMVESEFIMCDEIIEKSEFKGKDVVCFNVLGRS